MSLAVYRLSRRQVKTLIFNIISTRVKPSTTGAVTARPQVIRACSLGQIPWQDKSKLAVLDLSLAAVPRCQQAGSDGLHWLLKNMVNTGVVFLGRFTCRERAFQLNAKNSPFILSLGLWAGGMLRGRDVKMTPSEPGLAFAYSSSRPLQTLCKTC